MAYSLRLPYRSMVSIMPVVVTNLWTSQDYIFSRSLQRWNLLSYLILWSNRIFDPIWSSLVKLVILFDLMMTLRHIMECWLNWVNTIRINLAKTEFISRIKEIYCLSSDQNWTMFLVEIKWIFNLWYMQLFVMKY